LFVWRILAAAGAAADTSHSSSSCTTIRVMKTFLPVPAKYHYNYALKFISGVVNKVVSHAF
jgi:hypothetical protein